MTDQEWLTALNAALDGANWTVERATVTLGVPYAFAVVQHRHTTECKVAHYQLLDLGHLEIMKTDIRRQWAN
jgi:hypothetical protein